MEPPPSGKAFLKSLFKTLASCKPVVPRAATQSHEPTSKELQRQFLSSPQVKQLLLTLHCIFPDHLLPALDLLERSRVSHHVPATASSPETMEKPSREEGETLRPDDEVSVTRYERLGGCYYVEASSLRSNRFAQPQAPPNYYEVRLLAWSCSCPAFTFAALEGELDSGIEGGFSGIGWQAEGREEYAVQYGGLARGDKTVPMCKHLLACLLATSSPYLYTYVKETEVTREEMAAWAAGWIP